MDETAKKTRDALGRWLKGVSGNPKGRPEKFARVDHGDLQTFKNSLIEVNTPDGPVMMTREAAVLHRLYQSAMKGNVHAQIFLSRRFEKHHEGKAVIAAEALRLWDEIKRANRKPTEDEMALFHGVRMHLGEIPWPEEEAPKISLRKSRRRKPQPPVGKRDAGSDS